MVQLANQKCVACRVDSPPLTSAEISELKPQIPGWNLIERDEVRYLRRSFQFMDFGGAMKFADEVGRVSESEGHHPQLVVEWGWVTITWWTHAIRDLHRNDFIMALKSAQLYRCLSSTGS